MSSLIASLNSSRGLVTRTANVIRKQMILQLVPKNFFFKNGLPTQSAYTYNSRGISGREAFPREGLFLKGSAEGKGELLG